MSRPRPLPALALIDWGIGGQSVRLALRAHAPSLAVAYVSDTGAAPYGTLSPAALVARLERIVHALAGRGVSRVYLACNAASTALLHAPRFAVPTEGIVPAGVATVLAAGARRVGVVGGRRTVRSGVYRHALSPHGVEVRARVAQPLSAAIEAGEARSAATYALVRGIVRPLSEVDAVLLACTHYPAAIDAFRAALPSMRFLDPADEAARSLAATVGRCASPAEDVVLTTGDPEAMRRAARGAFGIDLGAIERLRLDGEA